MQRNQTRKKCIVSHRLSFFTSPENSSISLWSVLFFSRDNARCMHKEYGCNIPVLLLFFASQQRTLTYLRFLFAFISISISILAMFDVKSRNFSRYWCYYNKRLNIYHLKVWVCECVSLWFMNIRLLLLGSIFRVDCYCSYYCWLVGWLRGVFEYVLCVAPRAIFMTPRWKQTDIIFAQMESNRRLCAHINVD